jgi:hypothetical protein
MANSLEITAETVELDATDGVAFVEQASPLTRLHYFDGKFLRADALALEQDYHRHRVRLSNLAGGWGAVHGFGVSRSGNRLDIGAGLAITAAGNFVLATADFAAQIDDLLKVAAPPPPSGSPNFADCLDGAKPSGVTETNGLAIYEITVGPVEGLCGNEPVYGKLCESACATDSRHPYWREGVVLRLRPVSLQLAISAAIKPALAHLRNRIASAYFAAEPWLTDSLVSGAGLASHVWCEPAMLYGRDEVVIGLLAREGGITRVLDAWSGRRERMDTQARGYWQGRMSMRPWNVFVAQILQFQCQLAGLFEGGKPVFEPEDDCEDLRTLLEKTRKDVDGLLKRYSESAKKIKEREEGARPTLKEFRALTSDLSSSHSDLDNIAGLLADAELGQGALPKQRMLLSAGFFELPPAGYLPVDPQIEIEEQVQRMFGEGVKLHFHAVRHDEIAHLVEEAQHMERISLTRGLDNPKDVEQVEIFVPDGRVLGAEASGSGIWWALDMLSHAFGLTKYLMPDPAPHAAQSEGKGARSSGAKARDALLVGIPEFAVTERERSGLEGLVRTESREDGSQRLTLVCARTADPSKGQLNPLLGPQDDRQPAIYLSADLATDPFALKKGGETAIRGEFRGLFGERLTILANGTATVMDRRTLSSSLEQCRIQLDLLVSQTFTGNPSKTYAKRLNLVMQREGDSAVGALAIDLDETVVTRGNPVELEWDDDTPRQAEMFEVASEAREPLDPASGAEDTETPPEKEALRRRLLGMTALAAMPAPKSAIEAEAMNTLVQIGEATEDTSFLLRARSRLFPAFDAPATQLVRAVRDWVMFRRARTHLCGPVCEAPPAQGLEAFQVWHIKVEKKEEIAKLKAALDNHNQNVLAEYKFARVGMLRYRDESAFSEESASAVLDMWQPVKPGPQVALGRVWETAPATGQGWQNHFRMRNMLKQIGTLTKTPATGVLAAIPVPSDNLNDGAFDGGMLIVTTGQQEQPVTRNALLIYTKYGNNQHFPGGGDTPRADMSFVNDLPKDDTHIDFTKNKIPNGSAIHGVTLATVQTAPDAGAKKRVDAAVAAIVASGRPAPPAARLKNGQLSTPDRDRLTAIGISVEKYDEIIFFEVGD